MRFRQSRRLLPFGHFNLARVTNETVLVTGAGGFVGARVLASLLSQGARNIRAFVRPSSRLDRLREVVNAHSAGNEVKILTGDLLSPGDCRRAAEDVSVILHLAAGVEKSFAGAFMNSALATRNLIDAFLSVGRPGRFVNVSSFAVYSTRNLRRGALLDEACPLEDNSQERGDAYGFGKLKQDAIVQDYGVRRGLPYVIVRPGSVFGPGKKALTGRVGIDTFGVFLHLGGSNRIPLTYVDNCADAIVRAGFAPGVEKEVFNIVDDDLPTSRQMLRRYKHHAGRKWHFWLPYWVAYALSAWWENYSRRSQGQLPAVFNRRRCQAEWKGQSYTNRKLKERLGWHPRVPMGAALDAYFGQFEPPPA